MKKLAAWLYGRLGPYLVLRKVRKRLQVLRPWEDTEEALRAYYTDKLKRSLWILAAGAALAAFVRLSSLYGAEEAPGVLRRRETGGGSTSYRVLARRADGYAAGRKLEVGERQLREEELERLYRELLTVLERRICPEGSLAAVESDLYLPVGVADYPFALSWESGRPDVLGRDGSLNAPEKETAVPLKVVFRYGDFQREHTWNVTVKPSAGGQDSAWEEVLDRALSQSEEQSRYETEWILPQEAGGQPITWLRQTDGKTGKILGLTAVAVLAAYVLKDRELENRAEERDRRLSAQYGAAVNKLALYMGAGMTVRGAWEKTAGREVPGKENDYGDGVYGEMRRACREMQSGVPEPECYERFGRRCGLPPYMKLGALLAQNVKMGNRALLERLREESENAMEERRHQARREGEEAGTKLLGPMMLLLAMALLLVIVPAFGGLAD